eukprot:115015_1
MTLYDEVCKIAPWAFGLLAAGLMFSANGADAKPVAMEQGLGSVIWDRPTSILPIGSPQTTEAETTTAAAETTTAPIVTDHPIPMPPPKLTFAEAARKEAEAIQEKVETLQKKEESKKREEAIFRAKVAKHLQGSSDGTCPLSELSADLNLDSGFMAQYLRENKEYFDVFDCRHRHPKMPIRLKENNICSDYALRRLRHPKIPEDAIRVYLTERGEAWRNEFTLYDVNSEWLEEFSFIDTKKMSTWKWHVHRTFPPYGSVKSLIDEIKLHAKFTIEEDRPGMRNAMFRSIPPGDPSWRLYWQRFFGGRPQQAPGMLSLAGKALALFLAGYPDFKREILMFGRGLKNLNPETEWRESDKQYLLHESTHLAQSCLAENIIEKWGRNAFDMKVSEKTCSSESCLLYGNDVKLLADAVLGNDVIPLAEAVRGQSRPYVDYLNLVLYTPRVEQMKSNMPAIFDKPYHEHEAFAVQNMNSIAEQVNLIRMYCGDEKRTEMMKFNYQDVKSKLE